MLDESEMEMNEYWEPEPDGVLTVNVKNLKKTFKSLGGTKVHAVKNVSFSAYQNQILALLGHNGAGKTTTMSILTGLFSSSGGSATIGGNNINSCMNEVRKDLGLCPQHNMLFPSLTVLEHLFFFGMVKYSSC